MKLYKLLIVLALFTSVATSAMAQGEAQIKTLFVYNFTRYIQWPETNGTIKIGLLGNDQDMLNAFNEMAAKKSSATMKIVVETFDNPAQANKYNLVYITADKSASISAITKDGTTLLVTEKAGLTKKGSDINFVNKDGKLRFEMNQQALEASKLQVARQLVSLAIVV